MNTRLLHSVFIACIFILFSSCQSQKTFTNGSSVRFLRGSKEFVCGTRGFHQGKYAVATVYAGDPFLQRKKFMDTHPGPNVVSSSHYLYGASAKYFFPFWPVFRGIGLGVDYSIGKFMVNYDYASQGYEIMHRETLYQQRLNYSMNFVLRERGRRMTYLDFQTGLLWTKQNLIRESASSFSNETTYSKKLNFRTGLGCLFYLRRNFELNVELGCGGGSYGRIGIGYWFF